MGYQGRIIVIVFFSGVLCGNQVYYHGTAVVGWVHHLVSNQTKYEGPCKCALEFSEKWKEANGVRVELLVLRLLQVSV